LRLRDKQQQQAIRQDANVTKKNLAKTSLKSCHG
jgi:hypothetical protein